MRLFCPSWIQSLLEFLSHDKGRLARASLSVLDGPFFLIPVGTERSGRESFHVSKIIQVIYKKRGLIYSILESRHD